MLDVATRYSELGEALLPLINPILVGKYGIEMTRFVVENVSVPPEVEAAIDKRSSMAAVGNLNDYVKFQMAQGFEHGGSSIGGVGAEMAVGFAIAKEMMNQAGGVMAQTTPAAGAAGGGRVRRGSDPRDAQPGRCGQGAGRLRSRRDRQPRAGDLKGKRIGSQWRVTRAALAEFLK